MTRCICTLALTATFIMTSHTHAEPNPAAIRTVTSIPDLVAFWTFAEPPGQPRRSIGTDNDYPLQEANGPVQRTEGGPFSGYAAALDGNTYLMIPHEQTGELNIGGPHAQVTMFAVVHIPDVTKCRTIAGMWDEGHGAYDDTGTRQYAMLMHMPMYGGDHRLTPHISAEGGVTRRADGSPLPWNADYAASKHPIPEGQWITLGFTYDGQYIRAYVNGSLEPYDMRPQRDNRTDPYFTKQGPAGGPRGMNPYYHGRGIFQYDPARHADTKPRGGSDFTVGSRIAGGGEPSHARFGGLAIFNRALTDTEMKSLHNAANIQTLNHTENNRTPQQKN